MTSPNQPKPDPTSDKYDDVYSVGSRFGQDLTESSIRSLLIEQGKSPFQQAMVSVGTMVGYVGLALESAWSWLTGGPRYDIPENFMPLEASAYAVLEPVKTGVDEALESARSAEAEMLLVREELAVLLPQIAADLEESQRLLGEAREQLTAAQESNARTQQVVQDAVESGTASADLAQAMAQEAIAMVDEAGLILVEVRSLNVLAEGYAESALGHATRAGEHVQTSQNLVNEGRGVLSDVVIAQAAASDAANAAEGLLGQVVESNARTQQAVEAAATSAASSADLAIGKAQEAIVLVDEADLILAEVRSLNVLVGEHAASAQSAVTDARQARDDASSSLSSARGVLDQVEDAGEDVQALHTQVLGLHQDTLTKHGEAIQAATDATGALADAVLVQQDITTKHGEVLTRHGDAIRLTASSSASASMAAMQALMAADSLSETQDAQTSTLALHTEVLARHGEVATKHSEVLTKHGQAINAASAAAKSASDAAADTAAGLLVQKDITTKHGEVIAKHGDAIKLTASSSANASIAAMQALMAADSLSETQDAHTSTLALHADVITKHDDAIGKLSTAVQLQEDAARLQAIINRNTLTALEVHENLNKWRDATRARIGSTVNVSGNPSPWNSMCDDFMMVRSADDRRRVEWTAPGSWAGKVIFLISWNTATLTGDDYFTNHYFIVEEGHRGTWIPSPKNLQYVRQVSVFIEPWWGLTKREFVVQVKGADDGQFVPTSAYTGPRDMISFPTGQARQPAMFAFDVTANHPVRSYPPGGSQVWHDVGSRIQANRYIIPAHEAGLDMYPAVVKFTEA